MVNGTTSIEMVVNNPMALPLTRYEKWLFVMLNGFSFEALQRGQLLIKFFVVTWAFWTNTCRGGRLRFASVVTRLWWCGRNFMIFFPGMGMACTCTVYAIFLASFLFWTNTCRGGASEVCLCGN